MIDLLPKAMPEKILPQNPCKLIFINDVGGGGGVGVEEGDQGVKDSSLEGMFWF